MCVISLRTRGALDTWSRGRSTAALCATLVGSVLSLLVRPWPHAAQLDHMPKQRRRCRRVSVNGFHSKQMICALVRRPRSTVPRILKRACPASRSSWHACARKAIGRECQVVKPEYWSCSSAWGRRDGGFGTTRYLKKSVSPVG